MVVGLERSPACAAHIATALHYPSTLTQRRKRGLTRQMRATSTLPSPPARWRARPRLALTTSSRLERSRQSRCGRITGIANFSECRALGSVHTEAFDVPFYHWWWQRRNLYRIKSNVRAKKCVRSVEAAAPAGAIMRSAAAGGASPFSHHGVVGADNAQEEGAARFIVRVSFLPSYDQGGRLTASAAGGTTHAFTQCYLCSRRLDDGRRTYSTRSFIVGCCCGPSRVVCATTTVVPMDRWIIC